MADARTSCVLCEELASTEPDPIAVGFWSVVPTPGPAVPGWYLLVLHRHVEDLADLSTAEAGSLGPTLAAVSTALRRTTDAARVYVASFGENQPHVHFLVAARPSEERRRGASLLLARSELADEERAASHRARLAAEMAR